MTYIQISGSISATVALVHGKISIAVHDTPSWQGHQILRHPFLPAVNLQRSWASSLVEVLHPGRTWGKIISAGNFLTILPPGRVDLKVTSREEMKNILRVTYGRRRCRTKADSKTPEVSSSVGLPTWTDDDCWGFSLAISSSSRCQTGWF